MTLLRTSINKKIHKTPEDIFYLNNMPTIARVYVGKGIVFKDLVNPKKNYS